MLINPIFKQKGDTASPTPSPTSSTGVVSKSKKPQPDQKPSKDQKFS